jgi:hypothetical protein
MAHFVQLDESNKVLQVIVVDNKDCGDLPFPESEIVGLNFLSSLGFSGTWKQTSYNNNFRQRYAGIGSIYIEEHDIFTCVQPYPSWILNSNYEWESPISVPSLDGSWVWNESLQEWQR